MARFAPIAFICIWSGAFIAVRAGLPDVSPLFFLTIRFAMAHYRNQMSEIARRLGIGRSTLYRKLTDLGIDNAA